MDKELVAEWFRFAAAGFCLFDFMIIWSSVLYRTLDLLLVFARSVKI